MHFHDDIASNNCEQDVTISHDMGQYDTENLSTSEIQKLKKHLETELAYRLLKEPTIPIDASFDLPHGVEGFTFDDDDFPFDDDDFEADNDNYELYPDELDRGWSIDIDHEYPGQVAAERNCIRFMSVIEEFIDCEIIGVSSRYDRDGNPVAVVKYYLDGIKEAQIVFKVNHGLEDIPVNIFARAI
jgi:hypothetical protein